MFLSCNILEAYMSALIHVWNTAKPQQQARLTVSVQFPRVHCSSDVHPSTFLLLSASPQEVSAGAPVIQLCYMPCLQLWRFSSFSSSSDLWWFKWVGLIMLLLLWRYAEQRGGKKTTFATSNSTCLLRACHWVRLQLTTKPHWFHNLLLPDVIMFFSKFNEGSGTSLPCLSVVLRSLYIYWTTLFLTSTSKT